jgi:hypothetical protein
MSAVVRLGAKSHGGIIELARGGDGAAAPGMRPAGSSSQAQSDGRGGVAPTSARRAGWTRGYMWLANPSSRGQRWNHRPETPGRHSGRPRDSPAYEGRASWLR